MAVSPVHSLTPVIGVTILTVASTAPGDYANPILSYALLTAGVNGTRVERIVINFNGDGSAASTSKNGIRFWYLSPGNVYYLYYGWTIFSGSLVAGTATTATYRVEIPTPNLVLPVNSNLRVTFGTSAGTNDYITVMVFGADL